MTAWEDDGDCSEECAFEDARRGQVPAWVEAPFGMEYVGDDGRRAAYDDEGGEVLPPAAYCSGDVGLDRCD